MLRTLSSVGRWIWANCFGQVRIFLCLINFTVRNIVSDYTSTITSQQSSATSISHYQSRQINENEYLSPSSSKIRGANHSEIFQQHRHQHQSDFGIDTANDAGYETIGSTNLIGNLIEQMKPDVDSTLTNFGQLYSSDVSTTTIDGHRGIASTQAQPSSQDQFSFLDQKQTPITSTTCDTKKQNVSVPSTSSPINSSTIENATANVTRPSNWTNNSIRPTPPELQCQACQRMVVSRSTSLMYHVNVKHLKLAMFKCRHCGEEFLWNKSAAIRHAQRHGGDENMIENNTERHFPTLNRHKREYFNLGRVTNNSTCREDSPSSQYFEEGKNTEDEIEIKREKLELETPELSLNVKNEHEDTSKIGDAETSISDGDEKKEPTPNSILAQLVDITRGNKNDVVKGDNVLQRRSTGKERIAVVKGINNTTNNISANTSTTQTVSNNNYSTSNSEHVKAHKSIQCGGCGDMVVNQEWIMLNHVNTKHLHLPLYKCVSCNKPFENYLRSYAVRHAKFYHAGDESLLIDQREMFWSDLREACTNLFKSGGGGSSSS
ncbi:C2H2-type domain-containing protein [Meloidogyne graminicola]|uniref:C2H2-type domain-containing protein n=1 Tax=Meloidogyne graminicola TaxID=189291 RepID=A0A8T0A283_9BILA|nr:C2H2-type domain-containing protein [Meloidogyne graminicola]